MPDSCKRSVRLTRQPNDVLDATTILVIAFLILVIMRFGRFF